MSVNLNDPRMKEHFNRDLTAFWDQRYASAPKMHEGDRGYVDYSRLDTAERNRVFAQRDRHQPDNDRERLVKNAESTGYVAAGLRDGAQESEQIREADRRHREDLGKLMDHDRERGYPVADPDRDLSAEQPTVGERAHFAQSERYDSRDVVRTHMGGAPFNRFDASRATPVREGQSEERWEVPRHMADRLRQDVQPKPRDPDAFDASKIKVRAPTLAAALGKIKR